MTNNLIDPPAGAILAQFDGGGNLLAHYTYGLGLVSQVSPGGSAAYYDFDRHRLDGRPHQFFRELCQPATSTCRSGRPQPCRRRWRTRSPTSVGSA